MTQLRRRQRRDPLDEALAGLGLAVRVEDTTDLRAPLADRLGSDLGEPVDPLIDALQGLGVPVEEPAPTTVPSRQATDYSSMERPDALTAASRAPAVGGPVPAVAASTAAAQPQAARETQILPDGMLEFGASAPGLAGEAQRRGYTVPYSETRYFKLPEGTDSDSVREQARAVGRKWLKNPTAAIPFVGGFVDIARFTQLLDAANRIKDGEGTEDDRLMVEDWAEAQSKDKGFMYQVLDTVAQLPAFWGEMWLTSGIFTGAKKAATRAAVGLLKKIIATGTVRSIVRKGAGKRTAASVATRVAGATVGALAQAPVATATRIGAATVRNMVPVELKKDRKGRVISEIMKDDPEFTAALGKAVGNNLIEVWSEHTGGAVTAVLAPLGKLSIIKSLQKLNPGKTVGQVAQFARRAGYNGILAEMGEERIGEAARGITGLQDWQLPTPQQLLVELVAFSVPAVGMAGASRMINARRQRKVVEAVRSAMEGMPQEQQDQLLASFSPEAQKAIAGRVVERPKGVEFRETTAGPQLGQQIEVPDEAQFHPENPVAEAERELGVEPEASAGTPAGEILGDEAREKAQAEGEVPAEIVAELMAEDRARQVVSDRAEKLKKARDAAAEKEAPTLGSLIQHMGGIRWSKQMAPEFAAVEGKRRGVLKRQKLVVEEGGEPSDTMVEMLKRDFPQVGITSESDLLVAVKYAEGLKIPLDAGGLDASIAAEEEAHRRQKGQASDDALADELQAMGLDDDRIESVLAQPEGEAPTFDVEDAQRRIAAADDEKSLMSVLTDVDEAVKAGAQVDVSALTVAASERAQQLQGTQGQADQEADDQTPEVVAEQVVEKGQEPAEDVRAPVGEDVKAESVANPWEMTADEVDAEVEAAGDRSRQDDLKALGSQEAVDRYNRLQRQANSLTNPERADAASAEIEKIESGLTDAQQRLLWGTAEDPRLSVEELQQLQDAHAAYDPEAPTEHLLGYLRRELPRVKPGAIEELKDLRGADVRKRFPELVSAIKIREAVRALQEKGVSEAEIMRGVDRQLHEQGIEGADRETLLRDWIEAAKVSQGQTQPLATAEPGQIGDTSAAATSPSSDVPAEMPKNIPTRVQRLEEDGAEPGGVSKPQGLYTTPATADSPHKDLGGKRRTWKVNPDANVLTVRHFPGREMAMRERAVDAGAGVHAARQILGDEQFDHLRSMSKDEAVAWAQERYPNAGDFARSYDLQELIEKIGGAAARASGYDAMWQPDEDPDFSEFVMLTDKAASEDRAENTPAPPDTEPVEGAKVDEGDGRLSLTFPKSPKKAVRDRVKAAGFRWSKPNTAWQMTLDDKRIEGARALARQLAGQSGVGTVEGAAGASEAATAAPSYSPEPHTDQPRAGAGGEMGPNGEFYPGGAFIATTELPKAERARIKRDATGRVQVDIDGEYAVPEPGQMSILDKLGGTYMKHDGTINEQYIEYQGLDMNGPRDAQIREAARRFQAGERWVSVNEFPALANYKDAARLLNAGRPVPGAIMEAIPDKLRGRLQRFEVTDQPVTDPTNRSTFP